MTIRQKLEDNKSIIIDRYQNNESMCSIAKTFGCSDGYIFNMLKKWNEPIRVTKTCMQYEDKILELYKEGKSCYKINKELSLIKGTAERYLKKNGYDVSAGKYCRDVPLSKNTNSIIEYYNKDIGIDTIAKIFDAGSANIRKILIKNGIKIKDMRYYANPVDEDFFNKIDSHEKAYVLGFFMADGCNSPEIPVIRLAIADLDILEDIAKVMKFGGEFVKNKKKKLHHKQIYTLSTGSRKLSDALTKLGCVKNKTYIAEFPNYDKVPKEFMNSLVRGWLDGDGTITKDKKNRWSSKIIGTKQVCLGLSIICNEILGFPACTCIVNKNPKNGHESWKFGVYGHNQLKSFLNWIYKDATIYLKRKHEKYQEFLKETEENK